METGSQLSDLRIAGTKMGFTKATPQWAGAAALPKDARQGLLLFLETLGDSPYITALDVSNNES